MANPRYPRRGGFVTAPLVRNPRHCVCMGSTIGPSTHRGAAHFTSCAHSELRRTTVGQPLVHVRPVVGTRRLVAVDV